MLINLTWWLRGHKNIVSRNLYRILQFFSGAYVSSFTHYGNQPCFPHGFHGIFISGEAKIGKDCVIFQNVTIGSNYLADSKQGAPTIGDNCYIGAGVAIIGDVTIGNNVRIGANSTVYKDVPDNCAVVSAEQRNIEKTETPDNRYRTMRGGKWHYWRDGQYHQEK